MTDTADHPFRDIAQKPERTGFPLAVNGCRDHCRRGGLAAFAVGGSLHESHEIECSLACQRLPEGRSYRCLDYLVFVAELMHGLSVIVCESLKVKFDWSLAHLTDDFLGVAHSFHLRAEETNGKCYNIPLDIIKAKFWATVSQINHACFSRVFQTTGVYL